MSSPENCPDAGLMGISRARCEDDSGVMGAALSVDDARGAVLS